MSLVHEYQLWQLLNSLVDVWPEDQAHPLVDEARAYLEKHPEVHIEGQRPAMDYSMAEHDDDHKSMWFSI